jgi:hypothetical protein
MALVLQPFSHSGHVVIEPDRCSHFAIVASVTRSRQHY